MATATAVFERFGRHPDPLRSHPTITVDYVHTEVDADADAAAAVMSEADQYRGVDRHRNGEWELEFIEALVVGQERDFQIGGERYEVVPASEGSDVSTHRASIANSGHNVDDEQIVTTSLEGPENKLEVRRLPSKPLLRTMHAIPLHDDVFDVGLDDGSSVNSSCSSVESGSRSRSTSLGSTSSSVSSMSTTSHAARLAQASPVSAMSGNDGAEDHLATIVFDEVPDIRLEDRNDRPLPMTSALTSPLSNHIRDAAADDDDKGDAKSPPESVLSLVLDCPRRNRTGFVMQKQNDSKVSLQSYGELTEAEIVNSDLPIFNHADVSMTSLHEAQSRLQRSKPLEIMLSKTNDVTRRFHLQRDAIGKRSFAVLTPVSEAFERLTVRKESVDLISSKNEEVEGRRPSLKVGVIRSRWEFKGGFVTRPPPAVQRTSFE